MIQFPISTGPKEDHPQRVAKLVGVDPKYYYKADELKLYEDAINELANRTSGATSAANELIEKGFDHIINFDWLVFAQKYKWNGVLFDKPEDLVIDTITIDPAPTTENFKRFDVPVFNIDLTFSIVKGDEGLNPAIPKIDPRTQLQLTVILVEYGTTSPSYLTKQIMYDEGLGLPAEFAVTKTGDSITIGNLEQPSSGLNCIKVANPINTDVLFLDKNVTFNSLDVDTISFKVKNLTAGNWKIYLYSYNSIEGFYQGTAVIKNGSYGYDSHNITDYQIIIVPISKILGSLEIHNTGFALTFFNNAGATFFFDEFSLNGGFTQGPEVVSSHVHNNFSILEQITQEMLDNLGAAAANYTIDIVANQLKLYKDAVEVGSKDLSIYLDDTNLARLTSGVLNSTTGIATFTRDDASTFTLDLSNLLDNQTAAEVSVDSAAFTGNLAVTDNTVQKVAEKVDALELGGGINISQDILSETETITIPTYDGDLSVTHLDVEYVPNGWNGYKYWMAFSPYPASARENPSIVCSNDGQNWIVPIGLTNPLKIKSDAVSDGYTFWSDPDITLRPDGKMMVIFRAAGGIIGEAIYQMLSTDGINWTNYQQILTASLNVKGTKLLSPSLVYHSDTELRLYYINLNAGTVGNEIRYRISLNDGLTWGLEQTCSSPIDVDKFWHINVIKASDGYHALVNKEILGQDVGSTEPYFGEIYHIKSIDGIAWEWGYGNIERQEFNKDNGFYRSTFVAKAGNPLSFEIWLSGIGLGDAPLYDSEWMVIHRKNVNLNEKPLVNVKTSAFTLENKHHNKIIPIDNGGTSFNITVSKKLRRDFTASGIIYGNGTVSFINDGAITLTYPNVDSSLVGKGSSFFIIRNVDEFIILINKV